MAPTRIKCSHCSINLKPDQKRRQAEFLWNFLEGRSNPKGIPYAADGWFCNKCRIHIRRTFTEVTNVEEDHNEVGVGEQAEVANPQSPGDDFNGEEDHGSVQPLVPQNMKQVAEMDGSSDTNAQQRTPRMRQLPPNVVSSQCSHLTSSSASTEPPQFSEEMDGCEQNVKQRTSQARQLPQNVVSSQNSHLTSTSASTEPPQFSEEMNGSNFEQVSSGMREEWGSIDRSEPRPCCSKSLPQRNENNTFEFAAQNRHQIRLRKPSNGSSYQMHSNIETQYSNSTAESQSQTQRAGLKGNIRHTRTNRKIKLPHILSISHTQSKCWFCRIKCRRRMRQQEKYNIWLETRVWIPEGTRCCLKHVPMKQLDSPSKAILISRARYGAALSKAELTSFIHMLTNAADRSPVDLDVCELADQDYLLLFGLRKHHFLDLLNQIQPSLRQSCNRSPQNALAIFLMKLRLGVSQQILGFLFGVPQKKISTTFWRVAEILEKEFVPKHLGYNSISRENARNLHDSEFVRKLYAVPEDQIVLFLDGTYLYVEKSGDHDLQRRTYSMQKNRNLLKTMIVILPSGYIVDCAGMFFSDSDHNDANILNDMFINDNGIDQFTSEGDYFIVDRGFRDVGTYLGEKGMQVKMPKLLRPGQKQFSAAEANESRMVTLTRWRIEAINSRLKNLFHFFDIVISAQYFNKNCDKKLGRLLRVACAIINCYRPANFKDPANATAILNEIQNRYSTSNTLKEETVGANLQKKKTIWTTVSGKTGLAEFPRLTLDELGKITLGQYQIKNAVAYVDEQLRLNCDYEVLTHKVKPGLLRVKLRSRYRRANCHNLWIEFGSGTIQRYYCQCRSGERTMGCCSHVASVLWFLGYKRHLASDLQPRTFGSGILEVAKIRAGVEVDAISDVESEDESPAAP